MNRLSLLSCTALAALAIGRPAHADNVELRIATLAPSGSPWMEVLDKANAEIKDKTAGRVTTALVFAALLIAGAVLYAADPVLATWLMGASVLPLLALLFAGRGGHPGRR